MASAGRKARGMRTQAALAQRWRDNGLFPWATDSGPSRPGRDILNTPGLSAEVKAQRESMSLPAALRQAEGNGDAEDVAALFWRHNGQGEQSMGDWTVTLRLSKFEELWRVWQQYQARISTPATGGHSAN